MATEYEIKFRATPAQLAALRGAFSEEETVFTMQTTYFDTPNGDLADRKYTLRQRMENDISVCTLKTPAGALGRGEFEVQLPRIELAIDKLCKLSGVQELSALVKDGLIPVCGARFTRIAKTVVLPDCTLELALDQGVLTGGGREIPLCEVEAELKSGSREAVAAFALTLAKQYGLQPEMKSKFRRALALAKGE